MHGVERVTFAGNVKIRRHQDVRSESAARPPNNGLRGALRRHLGERFHADAYARWAAGEVFEEVARTCGVSGRQVHRRAVAERWKERLEATQRKAAMLAVDQDAERLARWHSVTGRGRGRSSGTRRACSRAGP